MSLVRSQPPEPVSSVPGVTAALGAPTSAVRVQILGGVPTRRDGRSAMPRPAKPLSPVRLRSATPFRRWISFNSRTALCDGVNLGAAPSIHPSPASTMAVQEFCKLLIGVRSPRLGTSLARFEAVLALGSDPSCTAFNSLARFHSGRLHRCAGRPLKPTGCVRLAGRLPRPIV